MTKKEYELYDLLAERIDVLWEIELNRENPSKLKILHETAIAIEEKIKKLRT
jgi:hypothetical protein